jgi:hypothetical protein
VPDEALQRSWGDLVFHVLAHAGNTAKLASSAFDPAYVAFARRHLGPARSRLLGQDIVHIARAAVDHARLARAQRIACLFHDVGRAEACADRALADLLPNEVDRPELLAALRGDVAAELLRCAALLERDVWRKLPVPDVDLGQCERAVMAWRDVAPALESCRVAFVRSLRLRGRLFGREIWVGLPGAEPGPAMSHVGWQAAHEATVLEAAERARDRGILLDHDGIEHAAVVLLAQRSRAAGRGPEHACWYSHFGAGAPPTDRDSLAGPASRVVEDCLAGCQSGSNSGLTAADDLSGT